MSVPGLRTEGVQSASKPSPEGTWTKTWSQQHRGQEAAAGTRGRTQIHDWGGGVVAGAWVEEVSRGTAMSVLELLLTQ